MVWFWLFVALVGEMGLALLVLVRSPRWEGCGWQVDSGRLLANGPLRPHYSGGPRACSVRSRLSRGCGDSNANRGPLERSTGSRHLSHHSR